MSRDKAMALFERYLKQQRELGVDEIVVSPPSPGAVAKARPGAEDLEALFDETRECRNCKLAEWRTHFVFGEGNPQARLMFVGEAPGEEEDLQGRPFVGAAGQLLNKMIEAMGLSRDQVYIGNILKCRPPGNRDPLPEETVSCLPVLERQIRAIGPEFICALGRIAAQTLLGTGDALGKLRGRVHEYKGTKLVVTYHPAALLRNAQWKRPAWEDLKMLMKEIEGSGEGQG